MFSIKIDKNAKKICSTQHLQNCTFCPDVECMDNGLQEHIDNIMEVFNEELTLANERIAEQEKEIAELSDEIRKLNSNYWMDK